MLNGPANTDTDDGYADELLTARRPAASRTLLLLSHLFFSQISIRHACIGPDLNPS